MPDFRKSIEDANFKPQYEHATTTGPGPTGEQQTWNNPDEFTQSSAQELAGLLGATLSEVNYSGGPYSQNRPQYQLDFSDAKGDELDATMVYDRYQRDPGAFNQQMADELKYLRAPNHQGAVADERTWAEKGLAPINPLHPPGAPPPGGQPPPGGAPQTPYVPPPANIPGPTWPSGPPPNVPGPIVPVNPLPGPTGVEAVTPMGTERPGGYTSPAHELPRQSDKYGLLLNTANEIRGYEPTVTTPPAMDPIKMPGLLSSATPGGYTPPAYNKGKGLLALGMRNADNTPMTPQQLLEFGQTGKIPTPNDKEPPRVDATANSYRGGYR